MNSSYPILRHDTFQASVRAGLTPGQDRLLTFIGGFISRHGYSPSFAEMRDAMGFASTGAVASLIDGLEERGHISRLPGRHRSIMPTKISPPFAARSVSRETAPESDSNSAPGNQEDT